MIPQQLSLPARDPKTAIQTDSPLMPPCNQQSLTYDPTAAPSPLYRSLPDAPLPLGPLHLRRQSLRDAHPHRVATAQPVPNRVHGNGGGIVQLQFTHQVGAVFFDGLGT
jgi:hypothetical protein